MMKRDDFERFAKSLYRLARNYRADLGAEDVAMWSEDLQAYDIDELESAFAAYRRSPERHFPRVGQIIELLGEPTGVTAERAWQMFLKVVRSWGYVSSPYLEDLPLITHTVSALGWDWTTLCKGMPVDGDQLTFQYKRPFMETYEHLAKTKPDAKPFALLCREDELLVQQGENPRMISRITRATLDPSEERVKQKQLEHTNANRS